MKCMESSVKPSTAMMAITDYDEIVIDNLFMPNEINQRDEHF